MGVEYSKPIHAAFKKHFRLKPFIPFEINENTNLLIDIIFTKEELNEFGSSKPTLEQIQAKVEKIQSLDLSRIKISSIPTEIAERFINLEKLSLSIFKEVNTLEGLLNDIPKSSKLKCLAIRKANSTENVYKIVDNIKSLTELGLIECELLRDYDSFKSLLKRLAIVNIENCNFNEFDFQFICQCA